MSFYHYDVIVVGGGHAGVEAATASARSGAKTLLLTHQIETIGVMSCNPAIGGIGKGHLVKEIDALGGVMGRAADRAGIHWRTLNASKGPAVRATRVQADRALYRQAIWDLVQSTPNLNVFQQGVDDVVVENGRAVAVVTQSGLKFHAKSIVLTNGTFLNGKIHIGMQQSVGGRAGEPSSVRLADRLREICSTGRLKTGTPPRIDGRTIDLSKCGIQPSDLSASNPLQFSFWDRSFVRPVRQIDCYITQTSEKTHDIIRQNLHQSPMYAGVIEGVGPRYCPSIEDKVVRFADKNSHQIYLEPEGLSTYEVYPNGISTSLPFDIQIELIRSLPGCENAHITRPGYAIEYDFFDPRGLKSSLENKEISGLFFAGQINGTTGYEEAAGQGILAGINAARLALGLDSWSPARHEAYIGVLVDDLITRGTSEPYRMFTSRAEYRLMLREDNADQRLTPTGISFGLVKDEQKNIFEAKSQELKLGIDEAEKTSVSPENKVGSALKDAGIGVSKSEWVSNILRRPDVSVHQLMDLGILSPRAHDVADQMDIHFKYSGYLDRQHEDVLRRKNHEHKKIPDGFDFTKVSGLGREITEKLIRHRPETIGQAERISGVTPAAISLLLVHLVKKERSVSP